MFPVCMLYMAGDKCVTWKIKKEWLKQELQKKGSPRDVIQLHLQRTII